MSEATILTNIDERGVATLTMNRPELHNAFDDVLIADITAELKRLQADDQVRVVRLGGSGKSFSAGADLNWMRRMATYTREQNLKDAMGLADLMQTLNGLNKPTIALVQGAAYGGGVGLVACCDVAIATSRASFCLSEVKLGLIPAVISPYVIAAIGARACRRYFLSAEVINCVEALRLGLVHEVVEDEAAMLERSMLLCDHMLKNSPQAMNEAKLLIAAVAGQPLDEPLINATAARIANQRVSEEGREGLAGLPRKTAAGMGKRIKCMPRYWDDIAEGETLNCEQITLSLQDIVEFARKYDPLPFHVDEQAATSSRFGGIIASSLQTLSSCTRALVDAQGDMAILSGLGIDQVQLPNPVRPDDVLSIEACWTDLRRSRSKPDRGMATLRFKGVNQKGEPVIESAFKYMIACRG